MPTPYQVYCAECGNELEVTKRHMDSDGDVTVDILPCETCMERERDDAASTLNDTIRELKEQVAQLEKEGDL